MLIHVEQGKGRKDRRCRMGGYGYLREYRAEQNWRDARICAIYEGANGIHARTLATRGVTLNGVASARAFAEFVGESDPSLRAAAAEWTSEAERIAGSHDADAEADAFMKHSCALAYRAAWARIGGTVERSPDPERFSRLHRRVVAA